MLKLSLIIPTYNRAAKLEPTLNSLLRQSLPVGDWECIFVNNNSTDNTQEILQNFATQNPSYNIIILCEKKQGIANARNAGIAHASAPLIAFIDDDEEMVEDYAYEVCEFFARRTDVNFAAGAYIPRYEKGRPEWMSQIVESPIAFPLDLGNKERRFPRHISPGGGNMMVRRELFARLGAFDTSLGRSGESLAGGEDFELAKRYIAAGEQLWWIPRAQIYHIIPPKKLEMSYLLRLWHGIGTSKKQRAQNELGFSWWLALYGAELIKWGVILLKSFIYYLCDKPQKARYLILMRWHIGRGILGLKMSK